MLETNDISPPVLQNRTHIMIGTLLLVVGALLASSTTYFLIHKDTLKQQAQLNTQISNLQQTVQTLQQENATLRKNKISAPDTTTDEILDTQWKKLTYSGQDALTTENWDSFSFTSATNSFSVQYPATWVRRDTVFHDQLDKKVAEHTPVVLLKPGQTCFDANTHDTYQGRIETISQTPITIGQYSGAVRISAAQYEGASKNDIGVWYVHSYCIEHQQKAIIFMFYDDNVDSAQKDVFQTIMASVELF